MRIRTVVLASLLAAAGAHAQSVPSPASQASDSWSAPAPASTASYRAGAALPHTQDPSSSHFRFKERRSHMPPANAAQQHSGSAAVGAMGDMDRNGRPAVSCPQTPMDPACH